MEKYGYDLLCEIVGLPMGKEENPTFEGIAPVEEVLMKVRNYIDGEPEKSEYLQKYIAERKLAAKMKRRK